MKKEMNDIGKKFSDLASSAGEIVSDVSNKAKDVLAKSQVAVINSIDQNDNGKIDIEDVVILGMKTPGVRINRADFLRKEFFKSFPKEVIDKAIASTPALANISPEAIDKIADEVIKFERNCVSGISAALGAPGGVASVATATVDIVQYYAYMLRTMQKLMYLYGFPEIDTHDGEQVLDSETMNILIICLGAMYGVAGANQALHTMAKAFAAGASKKIMNTAITKGALFPIVKEIAKWFNVRLVKRMVVNSIDNIVPIVGGVVGGAITFVTFKPCCDKLKKSLQNTFLSNPNGYIPEDFTKDIPDVIILP